MTTAAPICARYTMTETGIIVKPDVFSTKNMICALEARSLRGLTSCICCIAFKPTGVAALSNPSIFAAIFIIIEPYAGLSGGNSGNNFRKKGLINHDITFTAPPRSPIFMIPIHKVNTPVKSNEISNPVFDISKVAFTMAEKTSVSPMKINLPSATINAAPKKKIQI